MSKAPRLLPLIAVAMGGVLAVKTLSGVQALPDLLAATRAQAEEAPKPAPKPTNAAASPLPSAAPAAAARPSPACIQSPTDLAREAGVSPGELQVLQNLGARRGQLDDREKALDTQLQLLAAAETKVDAKLQAVTAVKAQIQALLGQADQQQVADVDRLTLVYQKMKPRDAAAIMATLDDKVRIPVAAKMKDSSLAAILSQMPTVEAKKLTESLAQRADHAKQAMNAAEQAPPTPPIGVQSSDPLQTLAAAPRVKKVRSKHLATTRPVTPTAKSARSLAQPETPAPLAPAPVKAATALPNQKAPPAPTKG